MHRRICVHTNIATTKNHPNWLLNGHDEHCTEENDAILSWNSGICLLFMKWFFLHCSSIFLWKENENRLGFFFNSFISALIMTIWCVILICRTYCIQILREFLYFQNWNWEKNPQLTPPTLQIQYCYSLIHSQKYLGQPYCLQTSAFGVGV